MNSITPSQAKPRSLAPASCTQCLAAHLPSRAPYLHSQSELETTTEANAGPPASAPHGARPRSSRRLTLSAPRDASQPGTELPPSARGAP
eukprot:808200-Rhodomonas_salina.3